MLLKEIRKNSNLTIYELSKRSGVSQPYIKDLETGKKSPTLRILQKLAQALGVTVNQLIGEDSDIK